MDQNLYAKVMKDAGTMNSKAALVLQSTGTAHERHVRDKTNVAYVAPIFKTA